MSKATIIGIIPGDGIGRDVIRAARIVLDAIAARFTDIAFDYREMDVGEAAMARYGSAFPDATREGIADCDAILFGAVSAPYDFLVLSGIRYGFELYASVRPVKALPGVDVLQPDADMVVIRENTEGLYSGVGYRHGEHHVNLRVFTDRGMRRIIRFAFDWAVKNGRRKVTFTHKESILRHTDALMKDLFYEIAADCPAIDAEDMEVDACAMRMVMKPQTLDVILAENANGDVLSDVGGGVVGGLGFTPSGNIGDRLAMFEPIHGSAPKHADKDVVNPTATLMAARMMFDYLGRPDIAGRLQDSIGRVLIEGKVRTYDIGGSSSTSQFAQAVGDGL
ncbi:MAG: isocitrate/isopropylmalate family dehydrogenase [Alphaproteobacteria bacterium]|nr:isocitrate/isopropylmalate family dehydrogenase [Alphaproteobacteria bacterium]